MENVIFYISFVATLLSLVILRPFAVKYNLVDTPGERKNHIGKVPFIGGLCVFIGLLTSQIYFSNFDNVSLTILVTTAGMVLLGIVDDLFNLRATVRLAIQILLVLVTIFFAEIKLENLGYIFGSSNSVDLGFLSVPLTIIAVVGLTNAFNMIDGVDGLAGGLTLLAAIGIFIGGIVQSSPFTNIILAIVAGIIPFLIFNLSSSYKIKTFLGDGGSLFLGYIIAWALIHTAENVDDFAPSAALWCVAIPLFDFFGVIIIRIFEKRSFLIAGRDHIHHVLEIFGLSKTSVMLSIVSAGILMLVFGVFVENFYPKMSFPIFLLLFMAYLFFRFSIKIKKIK